MSRFPVRPRPVPRPRPTAGPTPGPTPAPLPTTFTLTTNIDTVPASAGVSTFNGITSNVAASNTLNTGDTLAGAIGGTNTLNITGLGNTATGALFTSSNIPTINFRGVGANGAADDQINLLLASGVANVNSTASISDLSVVQATIATTYALNNTISTGAGAGNNPDLNVNFAAGELLGSNTTAKFSANGAGVVNAALTAASAFNLQNAATGTANTAVEAASIATSGSNNIVLNLNSDVTTVTGTGSGINFIALNGLNATSNINFSASTGTNGLLLGAGLTTNDSVTGGSGVDTVFATLAGVSGNLNFNGVETLRLNAGSAGTAAFAVANGLTRIANAAGNQVNTVSGATGITNVDLIGGGASGAQNTGTLTLSSALAGASDTLNVSLSNGGTGGAAYTSILNVTGAETVSVTAADTGVGNVSTLTLSSAAGNTQSGLTALNLVTPGSITLVNFGATTAPTAGGSLTSLNASGVVGVFNSGNIAADTFTNGASITLGAGGSNGAGNVLNVGNEAATDAINITGGSFIDTVTVGTGIFTSSLGGGNDVFNGQLATQLNVQGGDGNDVIRASQGADTIIGNAGSNTYQYALGGAAVAAVAQVIGITYTTDPGAVGLQFSVTINGQTIGFQNTANSVANVQQAAANAINNSTQGANVVAAVGQNGLVTVTARTPGVPFVFQQAQVNGATTAQIQGITPNVVPVAATNAESNVGFTDLLTYVNANADVIDGIGTNFSQAGANAGVAGVSAVIAANTGLATFLQAPTSLTNAVTQVEAAIQNGGNAQGESAAFVFNGQAYLFSTDGVNGVTNADLFVQLQGINALTTGLAINGGNITGIA